MEEVEVIMYSPPKFKMVIGKYKYGTKYGLLSVSTSEKRYWIELWKLPEIEITEDSFLKWFLVFFPEGSVDYEKRTFSTGHKPPQTYMSTYGESERAVKEFITSSVVNDGDYTYVVGRKG